MHPLNVLFVAGFGPITQSHEKSQSLYVNTLNLPCVTNLGITNIYRADTYSYTSTDASGNVSFLYLIQFIS